MDDPFQTPDGFAWTYPCYVLRSTDGTTPTRWMGGYRCFPLFTDRDAAETFLVRSGFPPGETVPVELEDESAVLAWAVAVLPDDSAIAVDPIDASVDSFRIMPSKPMLDAIHRKLADPFA